MISNHVVWWQHIIWKLELRAFTVAFMLSQKLSKSSHFTELSRAFWAHPQSSIKVISSTSACYISFLSLHLSRYALLVALLWWKPVQLSPSSRSSLHRCLPMFTCQTLGGFVVQQQQWDRIEMAAIEVKACFQFLKHVLAFSLRWEG